MSGDKPLNPGLLIDPKDHSVYLSDNAINKSWDSFDKFQANLFTWSEKNPFLFVAFLVFLLIAFYIFMSGRKSNKEMKSIFNKHRERARTTEIAYSQKEQILLPNTSETDDNGEQP